MKLQQPPDTKGSLQFTNEEQSMLHRPTLQ